MRVPLALAALFAPLLWAAVPAADSAAPMCQGEEATIVDTEGKVSGTDGDDIIIGGHDTLVRAKAGRDKICVQGGVVDAGEDRDSVQVVGTEVGDGLRLRRAEDIFVSLGGGTDQVEVIWDGDGGGTGWIDVGEGGDGAYGESLTAIAKNGAILLDLKGERLEVDKRGYVIRGFEDAIVAARVAKVAGDSDDNNLFADSCRLRMLGGAGKDLLADASHYRGGATPCATRSKYMNGQRGKDRLWGDAGSETLIGGPGRDHADGREGIDRCVAEREKNCER